MKYLKDATDACEEAVQLVLNARLVDETIPSFHLGVQYHNLGLVYSLQTEFDKAIECFELACAAYSKSLENEELPNGELIISCEGRKGIALYQKGESEELREYGRELILKAWQYHENRQYDHRNHSAFYNFTEWKDHLLGLQNSIRKYYPI